MITSTNHTTANLRTIDTYIAGTVHLEPIEYYHMPDEVLAKAGIYLNDTMPIDYCAHINWDTQTVIVTIGDYIIASWEMGLGQPVKFDNSKGYGYLRTHTYIEQLPVAIISDVMGLLWPKL